jgi:hypothetical protein
LLQLSLRALDNTKAVLVYAQATIVNHILVEKMTAHRRTYCWLYTVMSSLTTTPHSIFICQGCCGLCRGDRNLIPEAPAASLNCFRENAFASAN